ncbi:hypothetical protein G6F64_013206 [Rhizopus arrhizus]|uniref:Uncharacterized protein n=1 Tax=Rhizopus oryzae TaxID=64495 RepID=A0A9P6WVQ2_RHIOR|nr:hypothetical protein G6F64_013206 [Rhizopus arrhizus]
MSNLFYLPHANRPGTDRIEWANGTRSDLVLIPDVINDEQRPLIIEFQKTVDKKFIKRAISYCLQASSRYGIDPVILIFCIDTVAESTEEKFENSVRLPCCATIPCDFWAEECLILSKKTIKQHINVEGSLNPLIALGMFFTYQASAITLLPRCEDPTLVFLYEVAKKSFQEMQNRDLSLLEELKNVYDTQLQDYKNTLSTIQTEEEPLHTITEQI